MFASLFLARTSGMVMPEEREKLQGSSNSKLNKTHRILGEVDLHENINQ